VKIRFYQIFDRMVACDFPLPGLSEFSRAPADISIEICDDKSEFAGFTWFHEWKVPFGQPVILGGKKDETYLLRFPGWQIIAFTRIRVWCVLTGDLKHLSRPLLTC